MISQADFEQLINKLLQGNSTAHDQLIQLVLQQELTSNQKKRLASLAEGQREVPSSDKSNSTILLLKGLVHHYGLSGSIDPGKAYACYNEATFQGDEGKKLGPAFFFKALLLKDQGTPDKELERFYKAAWSNGCSWGAYYQVKTFLGDLTKFEPQYFTYPSLLEACNLLRQAFIAGNPEIAPYVHEMSKHLFPKISTGHAEKLKKILASCSFSSMEFRGSAYAMYTFARHIDTAFFMPDDKHDALLFEAAKKGLFDVVSKAFYSGDTYLHALFLLNQGGVARNANVAKTYFTNPVACLNLLCTEISKVLAAGNLTKDDLIWYLDYFNQRTIFKYQDVKSWAPLIVSVLEQSIINFEEMISHISFDEDSISSLLSLAITAKPKLKVDVGQILIKYISQNELPEEQLFNYLNVLNSIFKIVSANQQEAYVANFVGEFQKIARAWCAQTLEQVTVPLSGYEARLEKLLSLNAMGFAYGEETLQKCFEQDSLRRIRHIQKNYGDVYTHLTKLEYYAKLGCVVAKSYLPGYYQRDAQKYQELAVKGRSDACAFALEKLKSLSPKHAEYQYHLGLCYEQFAITNVQWMLAAVKLNWYKQAALECFLKAGAAGCGTAYYRLGLSYQKGILTPIDVDLAYHYFYLGSYGASEALTALKVMSYDEKQPELAALANLYLAIRTCLQGDVKKLYDSNYLEQAIKLDSKKVGATILKIFQNEKDFALHTRLALLQVVYYHKLGNKSADINFHETLLDIVKNGCRENLKAFPELLRNLSAYINTTDFAEVALLLIDDSQFSIHVRTMILLTAQFVLNSNQSSNTELKVKLENIPAAFLVEAGKELTFIPSAPPLEPTDKSDVVLKEEKAPKITYKQQLEDCGYKGEIPEKLQDYLTKNLMEDPVIASDGHTYDRPTVPLLKGKSAYTTLSLKPDVYPNLEKRREIEEFVQEQVRNSQRNNVDTTGAVLSQFFAVNVPPSDTDKVKNSLTNEGGIPAPGELPSSGP